MELKQVLVDSDALRAIAGKLYSVANSARSIENTLESIVSESDGTWKGSAPKEAEADYKKLKKASTALWQELTKRASSIEEVCDTYEKTEGKNQQTVMTLSTEHIFG